MAAWSLAVPDWRERIRAGRSLLPDLPHLDQAQARRAVAIFNKLRLPDVLGTPALAEAGADWFREIVGALHGSFDPATRERMIREVFLKTSYAAALMVTTLLMNQRPRAEFLLVAPTVSLAHIAFSLALGMVDKDPDGFLRKRLHVQEHLRRIIDWRTKATLEIKAFDTTVLTGVKPTGVLLDELHEIAKVAAAERIIGQLRGGLLPPTSRPAVRSGRSWPWRGRSGTGGSRARCCRCSTSSRRISPTTLPIRRRGKTPGTGGW